MGISDWFKKKPALPQKEAAPETGCKPWGPSLMKIARLISYGDEAVLQEVSACTADPCAWFAAHQDRYEERGILSDEDLELIQWLGLVDILEEHGYTCERDWKDEKESKRVSGTVPDHRSRLAGRGGRHPGLVQYSGGEMARRTHGGHWHRQRQLCPVSGLRSPLFHPAGAGPGNWAAH